MKLSCSQKGLSQGLAVVGHAASTKAVLPITSHILLVADESRLRLTATNLETTIVHWIDAEIEEPGTVTVPARLFAEFVKHLPNAHIVFATPKPLTLGLHCINFKATMNGLDPEDFPPVPAVEESPTAQVNPETLRQAIGQVAFAAASDETRPVLAGVYTKFDGDQMTLAAANGFRLAVRQLPLEKAVDEMIEAIVPAKTYFELGRLLSEQEGPVDITVTKGQILFQLRDTILMSQLIQGPFPDVQKLIPETFASTVLVDAEEFRGVTRAAAIFARESNQLIRVQVEPGADSVPGRVSVLARDDEIGDNQGDIEAVVSGDAAKIAFNSKYLTDVLNVISTGQLCLQTNSPSSPGVFRQAGDESYVHVIMPVYVQW